MDLHRSVPVPDSRITHDADPTKADCPSGLRVENDPLIPGSRSAGEHAHWRRFPPSEVEVEINGGQYWGDNVFDVVGERRHKSAVTCERALADRHTGTRGDIYGCENAVI
jgi:hypothetical protein